jgi:predicted RNA binding protein YcfA (HicA-like mRNA interferase family)
MAKFPGLSGAQIVRALEKLVFVVARQSGSHIGVKTLSLEQQGAGFTNF